MEQTSDWADQTEQAVLKAALDLAPSVGWGGTMTSRAAALTGLGRADADLLFPHGACDLAALLARRHDALALQTLTAANPSPMKIRDRIRAAVVARLDAAAPDAPAVRRWAAFLAMPTNLPLAVRLVWASADTLWRWAGDTATDENHYSKRAILSEILISTLAVDLTSGRAAALTHLEGRIDAVMSFEKWKAGVRFKPGDLARDVAASLGRLRYR